MVALGSGEEWIRGNEDKIHVSVRLRPLNGGEILNNDVSDWDCISKEAIVYKNVGFVGSGRLMCPSAYTFDRVFGSDSSTRVVYEEGTKDVAISVVHGINSNIFAFGQTSSGKTYTMAGLTEYAIADIYEYIQKHPERDFILKFSAMEINGESVRDLLSGSGMPLRLIDDPERGTVIEDLTEEIVRNHNHVSQLLSICKAQNQFGEATFNDLSSMSHQIIRLTVESSSRGFLGRDSTTTLAAALNFVDLATSEGASQPSSSSPRSQEGYHINQSLLTLGAVISKLSNGQSGLVPCRDSQLTRILQAPLGGNARTAIVCTISPARSQVEQTRNTLLFASCAKEITTNAQVNVVISDKAMVKHLQKELERMKSELRRSSKSYLVPSNHSVILKDKDAVIEKLENEIKDLIHQRDIAQSQIREFFTTLGDEASPMPQGRPGNYPLLRVQMSQDEASVFADAHSLDADSRTGHSRSSRDDFVDIWCFKENSVYSNSSQRISISRSNSYTSESFHSCFEGEKQNKGTPDNRCMEIHCIVAEETDKVGSNFPSSENYTGFPAFKVRVIGDGQNFGSVSPASFRDEIFTYPPLKDIPSVVNGGQELISTPVMEDKESTSQLCEEDEYFGSLQYQLVNPLENPLQYTCIPPPEQPSLPRCLSDDTFGTESLNLSRSKSCTESTTSSTTDSTSPWLKVKECSSNTPSVISEKEFEGCGRNIYTLNFGSSVERLSREYFQPSPGSDLDSTEIHNPFINASTAQDGGISISREVSRETELQAEQEITVKSVEILAKVDESSMDDVGLLPIKDKVRVITSWPVELKRLRREIIELWHACHVSLLHRTYFFIVFQGDPADAIYLEVEMRRMRILQDKFSRGEEPIVNGQCLTLSSSKKALSRERQMLSKQMMAKLSADERIKLFMKWGIGVNTKSRRLQLAEVIWSKRDDINHVADSALLVAKLVGFTEPGQTPKREELGIMAPQYGSGICTFKRSLLSIM